MKFVIKCNQGYFVKFDKEGKPTFTWTLKDSKLFTTKEFSQWLQVYKQLWHKSWVVSAVKESRVVLKILDLYDIIPGSSLAFGKEDVEPGETYVSEKPSQWYNTPVIMHTVYEVLEDA